MRQVVKARVASVLLLMTYHLMNPEAFEVVSCSDLDAEEHYQNTINAKALCGSIRVLNSSGDYLP